MAKVNIKELLRDVVVFASAQKSPVQKMAYLVKGIIFSPFLFIAFKRMAVVGKETSLAGQPGDDIYPLF
jgi:hypothetical protein